MAYHKWSNLKLTLSDNKGILSCHMAQSSCFNWMVEKKEIFVWQYISENSNDVKCHILKLQHVNILVYIVVASVVTWTHP
jgi:hypothetical protein